MAPKVKAETKTTTTTTKSTVAKKHDKKSKQTKPNPLFQSNPRTYQVGGDIRPKKRNLARFVKWPRYVRLQRQRKILLERLKVPPSINQFSNSLDKNQATEVFKLLDGYRPETKAAKLERLRNLAAAKASNEKVSLPKPPNVIKFGLKHVTFLIEQKKAKLVCIANDVNPIELVVWLPALCRKMDIPYCIIKNKSRLGALVHKKNASVVCLVDVNKEDKARFDNVAKTCNDLFNENSASLRKWGGGVMGLKTQRKLEKRAKLVQLELAKKARLA